MHALDALSWLIRRLAVPGLSTEPLGLLGYVGLGSGGPELIPYFMALLTFIGAALFALLQWPIYVLLRYLSKLRRRHDRKTCGDAVHALETQSDATQTRD